MILVRCYSIKESTNKVQASFLQFFFRRESQTGASNWKTYLRLFRVFTVNTRHGHYSSQCFIQQNKEIAVISRSSTYVSGRLLTNLRVFWRTNTISVNDHMNDHNRFSEYQFYSLIIPCCNT